MEQNTKKSRRRMLRITVFALATLFFLMSCKKDKKDDNLEMLLAATVLNGGGKAEFRLTDTNTLAAARTAANSFQFRSGPNFASGFLTDLSGDNPESYGDGVGDGFNDKFLTPAAVSMEVCQMVLYKSVTKGGPARGSETLTNANFVAFGGSNIPGGLPPEMGTNSGPCTSFMPIGLKGGDKTLDSAFLPITAVPESALGDYDRIGIIVRGFSYYFNTSDVPENAYRYVDLILNNPSSSSNGRGDVSTKIFGDKCPASFANSASFIFSQLIPAGEILNGSCTFSESSIDSGSGAFLSTPESSGFLSIPTSFLNAPSAAGVAYTAAKKLRFKAPAMINTLASSDPYILIVDLDSSKNGKGLLFNVSVDKVLFWDSTGGDNVFSPQLDAADRPNATSGSDNLTNTARKNLIFHLPTILSQTK
ncbi:sigma factor sigX-regulated lipoprotein SrpA [Leptospira kmetyi]|uniref:sigma factor sigX-regulated lipoprotein SrpA n=1 Tax=Leptospira kmetyi TaxID=408139 RepID=UPI0013FD71CE